VSPSRTNASIASVNVRSTGTPSSCRTGFWYPSLTSGSWLPRRQAGAADLLGSGGRIRGQQVGYTRVSSQARLNARSCTVATQTPKAALKPLIELGERAERYFADGDGGSR